MPHFEKEGAGDMRDLDFVKSMQQTLLDSHERTIAIQLKQVEQLSELTNRMALQNVQLLAVVNETIAACLGKAVNGKDISQTLIDLANELKAKFGGGKE